MLLAPGSWPPSTRGDDGPSPSEQFWSRIGITATKKQSKQHVKNELSISEQHSAPGMVATPVIPASGAVGAARGLWNHSVIQNQTITSNQRIIERSPGVPLPSAGHFWILQGTMGFAGGFEGTPLF